MTLLFNPFILRKTFHFLSLRLLPVILIFALTAPSKILLSNDFPVQWEKRERPHFILYYRQSDHRLADYIMERAEEDYKRIVGDIGIDPEIKANVYLAPDRNIYRSLQPAEEKTHDWSIGAFYPHQNLILLLSPKAQKASHPDLQQIMAHELTHFILHAVTMETGIDLPFWLHEGLAMYEAREWNWHDRFIMAQISLTRSFLPLSSLSKGFPAEKRLAERAYAQSISLIAYIINRYGVDYLHRIMRHLIEGQTPAKAFYHVFGISFEAFERNWHVYLRRHYNWIPFLTSGFTIWFIISLLTLGIYSYKKRVAQKKLALWDIEDQIDSFLK